MRHRRRRGVGRCPTPLFLLLSLSPGAAAVGAAAAGFIIPATGRPAASATRLHSVNSPSSSSSAVPDPASVPGGLRPTIAAAAAAAAAPPRPSSSPTMRPAAPPPPPPPPPPPSPPALVVEPPLVWGPAPAAWGVPAEPAAPAPSPAPALAEEGGWRAAETRLCALVMGRGDPVAAIVVEACERLLEACLDVAEEEEGDEREEVAAAVAWVVQEVLLQQQKQQLEGDEELRMLALRACAATGAAEAAAALFLQSVASTHRQQQQPPPQESLELALEACSRAPSSLACDARAAALSMMRAAAGPHLSPRALGLAAAAIDNNAGAAGGAAGALRLLIGDARRAGAVLPAWLYTRAMRVALAEEEGEGGEGLSSAAAVVGLLYEEALGSVRVANGEEEEGEMMALHEAALAAHAAQGQWNSALAVLERLRTSGRAPSPVCFNHAVQACCLAGEWERGAGLLRRMEAAGLDAGEETYLGVLQALGKAGQWQGALKLLEHVTATQQRRQQQGSLSAEKGAAGLGVTPAMAKAAAAICVRTGKFAEARALVDRAMAAAAAGGEGPELLELGLWALVMAPSPLADDGSTAEEAARLIQRLMALAAEEKEGGGKKKEKRPISLDAYEHACQALAQSPSPEHHGALLRAVHAHAVAHQAIPALLPPAESGGPLDLRGLRPALARVALAEALVRLPMVGEEDRDGERPPLVLITGTGAIKAHVRRFLQSKACFAGRPFNPLPMPYNHGRLLLPWGQIRRWQTAGARVCLSSSLASTEEGESRRRQRLWKGIVDG